MSDKTIRIAGEILYTIATKHHWYNKRRVTTMETVNGKPQRLMPSIETIKTYLTHFFTVVGIGFVAYLIIYSISLVG